MTFFELMVEHFSIVVPITFYSLTNFMKSKLKYYCHEKFKTFSLGQVDLLKMSKKWIVEMLLGRVIANSKCVVMLEWNIQLETLMQWNPSLLMECRDTMKEVRNETKRGNIMEWNLNGGWRITVAMKSFSSNWLAHSYNKHIMI